jgi:hypothetical protein
VNQLVFERVDFFLQFSFDCVCHDLIGAGDDGLSDYNPLASRSERGVGGASAALARRTGTGRPITPVINRSSSIA